jgi:superfamily II DNA or RNA helicase
MAVTVVVGNVFSRIMGELTDAFRFRMVTELSYKLKDARFMIDSIKEKVGRPDWDGTVKLCWLDKGNLFYTGMMSDVLALLREAGIQHIIRDDRVRPEPNIPNIQFIPKESRDYQLVAVDVAKKATRGILQAATGGGKTYMVSKLIGEIGTGPFLFFVMSCDLLEQARTELESSLNVPIGMVGNGVVDIKDITVMMVQTAVQALNRSNSEFKVSDYRYDEEDDWSDKTVEKTSRGDEIEALVKSARGFYLDECHHVACRTAQEVLEAAKNAYWRYGGSATPFREDGAEKMLKALFGKVLVNVTASYLIQNDFLVRPYIFNVAMKEDGSAHLGKPKFGYAKVYTTHVSGNAKLHDLTVSIVNHLEKLGVSTLVLVQRYDHGDELVARKPEVPFIKGTLTAKKRKKILDGLRDGSIKTVIATTLADEGLDVKRLGAVVIAGGGKSITRVYQRVGRALRKFDGKDKALVFLFQHHCKFLDEHGIRVKHILKGEPEFAVIESTPETIISAVNDVVKPTVDLFG